MLKEAIPVRLRVQGRRTVNAEKFKVKTKLWPSLFSHLPPGFFAPLGILPFLGMLRVGSPSKCWS